MSRRMDQIRHLRHIGLTDVADELLRDVNEWLSPVEQAYQIPTREQPDDEHSPSALVQRWEHEHVIEVLEGRESA